MPRRVPDEAADAARWLKLASRRVRSFGVGLAGIPSTKMP